MKKIIVSICVVFVCLVANAQKMVRETSEYPDGFTPEMESQLLSAKAWATTGIVMEIASTACTLTGVLMSSYTTDQNRQTIKVLRIAGASGMLLSGVMILVAESKIHKIKNGAGQTVATISMQPTDCGAGLCLRF